MTASHLTMPTQQILLQLADPFTVPDYTDITPFVKTWSGEVRGRQHELQLFQPGQVSLTLESNLNLGRFNPWNTKSPYYNVLSADDAAQIASNGTWGNVTNCALGAFPQTPPVDVDNGYALGIVGNAGGAGSSITTTTSDSSPPYPVVAGQYYSAMCSFLASAGSTARAWTVGIQWYTSGGSLISTSTSSSVTDILATSITNVAAASGVGTITATNTFTAGEYVVIQGLTNTQLNGTWQIQTASGSSFTIATGVYLTIGSTADSGTAGVWVKASLLGVKAPATATYAAIIVKTTASLAGFEVHWACRAALFNYSGNMPNTAWAPGQRGLVPGRPIQCTATWNSVTYQIFSLYISNFTPQYGQVKSEQVLNCVDGSGLLNLGDLSTSQYAQQVIMDGAVNFWRLGDPFNALQAADIGTLKQPLEASEVYFGQSPPMLTDDTTSCLLASSSTQQGKLTTTSNAIAVGEQSVEIIFQVQAPTAGQPISSTPMQILVQKNGAASQYASIEWHPNINTLTIFTTPGSGITQTSFNCSCPTINDGQWHHLVVSCYASTNSYIIAYLDGVQVGAKLTGAGVSCCLFNGGYKYSFGSDNNPGGWYFAGNLADIAVYEYPLTLAQVQNHFDLFSAGFNVQYSGNRIASVLSVIGWPGQLQNLATGISQVQGATSSLTQTTTLSYLQQIESTEMGALFCDPYGVLTFYDRHYIILASAATTSQATFSNNPSTANAFHFLPSIVPAMDDTDLWNDIPGQANGGVLQRTTNAQSGSQYWKRSLTGYTGELQTTDNEVLAQTQWLATQYEQPYTRVREISLSSRTDAGANLPQMLGRAIFDQITVIWNPIDQSTVYFTQPSLIESITHTVTQQEWITEFGLSPAEVQNSYMILNNTIQGQLSTDNLLAY